jgi:hypothetical protein
MNTLSCRAKVDSFADLMSASGRCEWPSMTELERDVLRRAREWVTKNAAEMVMEN